MCVSSTSKMIKVLILFVVACTAVSATEWYIENYYSENTCDTPPYTIKGSLTGGCTTNGPCQVFLYSILFYFVLFFYFVILFFCSFVILLFCYFVLIFMIPRQRSMAIWLLVATSTPPSPSPLMEEATMGTWASMARAVTHRPQITLNSSPSRHASLSILKCEWCTRVPHPACTHTTTALLVAQARRIALKSLLWAVLRKVLIQCKSIVNNNSRINYGCTLFVLFLIFHSPAG